jgi:hypothetical protein
MMFSTAVSRDPVPAVETPRIVHTGCGSDSSMIPGYFGATHNPQPQLLRLLF